MNNSVYETKRRIVDSFFCVHILQLQHMFGHDMSVTVVVRTFLQRSALADLFAFVTCFHLFLVFSCAFLQPFGGTSFCLLNMLSMLC